jgi:hypothetical protein
MRLLVEGEMNEGPRERAIVGICLSNCVDMEKIVNIVEEVYFSNSGA